MGTHRDRQFRCFFVEPSVLFKNFGDASSTVYLDIVASLVDVNAIEPLDDAKVIKGIFRRAWISARIFWQVVMF